jgi:hypothetical protein
VSFSPFDFQGTKVDKKVITDAPLQEFVDYLLFSIGGDFKTVAFSHNGGRYDNVIMFKVLFAKGLCPSMIRNGNKLYELHVKRDRKRGITETVFRDSYNLAPFALGKFVKAFGLEIEEKRHFPSTFLQH